MAVISTNWITEKNGENYCLWPAHLKTEQARKKAVLEHAILTPSKCGRCKVNIKYKTGNLLLLCNSILLVE